MQQTQYVGCSFNCSLFVNTISCVVSKVFSQVLQKIGFTHWFFVFLRSYFRHFHGERIYGELQNFQEHKDRFLPLFSV